MTDNNSQTEFRLDPQQVEETFWACEGGDIEAEAIIDRATFDKAKLDEHKELITAMLLELPIEFRASGGGGWSFLNACDDRHGNQWTGLHRTMAMLFALGQAIGMVESLLPREVWNKLPGGMPYYIVKDLPKGE